MYRTDTERWLDYWSIGVNGQKAPSTLGGRAWRDQWSSLRYAANTAFCALVYADRVRDPNGRFSIFARTQIAYALGANPAGRSYVCGFGNNPPASPHHRGSHSSTTNDMDPTTWTPVEQTTTITSDQPHMFQQACESMRTFYRVRVELP